jgi:hypothetical protein
MKKVSTAAVREAKNFSEQKLTIGLDLGRSIELVLRAGRSWRHPAGTTAGHDTESDARSVWRQIRLRSRAAVLHRTQQLGIDPGQPRQRLRVHAVVSLSTLPDQTHLASLRHDYFMP